MNELNKEDLKNLITLLGRLNDIRGTEAIAVAILQNKLSNLMNKPDVEPTTVQEPEVVA